MSANLHPTGKRPVLRRMPQNVRLPYDVQGLFPGVGASAAISKQPEKRRFHSVSCEMLATVNGQQDVFQELARSANLPLAAGGAVAAHPEPPDPPAGQKEQDGGQRSQQDGPGGPVQQIE